MVRTLLVAALLAVPTSVYAQDKVTVDAEAKKVIEKAIDATGGREAMDKYLASNSKVKGELSMFGMEIPFTGEVVTFRPGKMRLQMDLEVQGQKMAVVQIVNGEKLKSTTAGAATPMTDTLKKEMRQTTLLMEVTALTPLLKGDVFTVKAEKDEKVGDSEASVILVTGKDLKDIKLYFDKKTGLMVKTSRKSLGFGDGPEPVEVSEETLLSEYKTVEGVKLPSKSVVTHDGKKYMTMESSDIKLMEKTDPKPFAVDD